MELVKNVLNKYLILGALIFLSPFTYATYPGFSLGLTAANVDYEEPGIMTEKGTLFGGYASFMTAPSEPLSVRVHGYLVLGSMDYDGALVNNQTGAVTPHSTSTKDSIIEIQPDIGVVLNPEGAVLLRLYAGLGVRYWQDKIEGPGGYRRNTRYFYLPLGAMASAEVASTIELSLEAQYNLWIGGQNETYLSDVGAGDDLTLEQNEGTGYQLAVQATLYTLSYRPFARLTYQSWDVEDSEYGITGGRVWVEPANDTQVLMLNLGFMLF